MECEGMLQRRSGQDTESNARSQYFHVDSVAPIQARVEI
jgi:hypothetical protein